MNVLLAPDVYVNASVALGHPPEKVVTRIFSREGTKNFATPWILERVRAMLSAIPEFKIDAVAVQMRRIEELVCVVDDGGAFAPDDWQAALVSAANKAAIDRVITDHPDLLAIENPPVEFISTEVWLLEQSMPPPPPSR